MKGTWRRLRVLDLGLFVAGPFAAGLLADFGHDVIKVERPGTGDPLRFGGLGPPGMSDYWLQEGRNKRSVTLDWTTPAGRDVLISLIERSDVLIENYRPGVMAKAGLDYDSLPASCAHIVYLSISGYGASGPRSHEPSLDPIAAAFAGLSASTGHIDHGPSKPGMVLADYLAGTFGAFAVLQAVWARDTGGGQGEFIDLGLYEPLMRASDTALAEHLRTGSHRERNDGLSRMSAPSGTYSTADGKWVCIATPNPKTFVAFTEVTDVDELHRLGSGPADVRRRNKGRIEELTTEWVARHKFDEVRARLLEAGVPHTIVNTNGDLLSDPHVKARGNVVETVADDGVPIAFPGVVPQFRNAPGAVRWFGEPLGASTDAVLKEVLDLDVATMDRLREEGVL